MLIKFTSILGVVLRALTLGSKLILLLTLAKKLSPSEVGTYGLLAATINYSIFVLGLEFYTYSTRELISAAIDVHPAIKNHALLIGACYLLASPALILFSRLNIFPNSLLFWFLGLLAMEHILREGNRFLVARGNAAASFIVSFISGGLWPWTLLAVIWFYPTSLNIQSVLQAWAVGVTMGCGALLFVLRDVNWLRVIAAPIDWAWMRRGLGTSIFNLAASASLIAIVTFDKYAVEVWSGMEMVGVYVFFSSLAFALMSFIEAGVVSITYPRLVRLYQQGNYAQHAHELRKFGLKILGTTLGLIALSASFISPLLKMIHGIKYAAHLSVYWLLLLALFLWVSSLIPHYALYARKQDRSIALSNVLGAAITGIGLTTLTPVYSCNGTALSVALGFLTILTSKSYFLFRQSSIITHANRNVGAI